jgi:uncharacterized protein YbjQ (UPF0145 family)
MRFEASTPRPAAGRRLAAGRRRPHIVGRAREPPERSYAMRQPAVPDFLTTTENQLTGYRIVARYGVVRGITVRSRSVFGTVGAKLQQLVGGNISLLAELCEQTRAESFALAVEHAQALGANALVAVRYDATEIMSGVSEVLCYGTAMRVVPERGAGGPAD